MFESIVFPCTPFKISNCSIRSLLILLVLNVIRLKISNLSSYGLSLIDKYCKWYQLMRAIFINTCCMWACQFSLWMMCSNLTPSKLWGCGWYAVMNNATDQPANHGEDVVIRQSYTRLPLAQSICPKSQLCNKLSTQSLTIQQWKYDTFGDYC